MPVLKGFRAVRVGAIATAVMVSLLVVSTLGLLALLTVWAVLEFIEAPIPFIWSAEAVVGVLVAIPCIRFGIHVWKTECGEQF